jgi:hypothetical protein
MVEEKHGGRSGTENFIVWDRVAAISSRLQLPSATFRSLETRLSTRSRAYGRTTKIARREV